MENNNTIRQFVERLKQWPEDRPPSQKELSEIRREMRLTDEEFSTLKKLVANHISRAKTALSNEDFSQATEELSRACLLRPRDPQLKVDLANAYHQWIQKRGFGRNHKKKVIRLLKCALDMQPNNSDARMLLIQQPQYAWALKRTSKRSRNLTILILIILLLLLWWQREWIITFISGPDPSPKIVAEARPEITPPNRPVKIETPGLGQGAMQTEILSASVGRRNEMSYLQIMGKMKTTEQNIDSLSLLIRGRDKQNNLLFSMPWSVLKKDDPPMLVGDTLPITTYRWLAESEENIDKIEISTLNIQYLSLKYNPQISEAVVVWKTARPDNISISARVRDRKIIEAFDRQVVKMDVVLKNDGFSNIAEMELMFSLSPKWPSYRMTAIKRQDAALTRDETRVLPVTMSIPLNVKIDQMPLIITVLHARRP